MSERAPAHPHTPPKDPRHHPTRRRLDLGADGVALPVAGDPGHPRPRLRPAATGMLDRGPIPTSNAVAQQLFLWRRGALCGAGVGRPMPTGLRHDHDRDLARHRITGRAHLAGKGRIGTGQRDRAARIGGECLVLPRQVAGIASAGAIVRCRHAKPMQPVVVGDRRPGGAPTGPRAQ